MMSSSTPKKKKEIQYQCKKLLYKKIKKKEINYQVIKVQTNIFVDLIDQVKKKRIKQTALLLQPKVYNRMSQTLYNVLYIHKTMLSKLQYPQEIYLM